MFDKVKEILLFFVSLGIAALELYNLINYFKRPRNYGCINGFIAQSNFTQTECTHPLHCDSSSETIQEFIKLINQGDILFEMINCIYLAFSLMLILIESIIFFKKVESNIIIKNLDYIALAIISIFQVPLCGDFGKCISMPYDFEYIKFTIMTHGVVYQIFVILVIFAGISDIVTVVAISYYIVLNLTSLKYLYASHFSNTITAVFISIKHFLTFLAFVLGVIRCCKNIRKKQEVNTARIVTVQSTTELKRI